MKQEKNGAIVSIHSTTKGLGWVVATSPQVFVDWGVSRARGDKNAVCLRKTKQLIEAFAPTQIVMRHASGSSRQRVKRIQRLIRSVADLAKQYRIEMRLLSEHDVRSSFERFGATTREEVASVLARNIEALSSQLPPKRKAWMTEDARLGLFDAAALAVTFFMERDLIKDPFVHRQAA